MAYGKREISLSRSFPVAAWVLAPLFAAQAHASTPSSEEPNSPQVEFFERKIRPVLAEHCYECHSARAKELFGALRVDTKQGIRRGGDTGPAIVPGDPSSSELIQAIRYGFDSYQMPPAGKLSDDVIADFEQWVRDGAVDPRKDDAPEVSDNFKNGAWQERYMHWAYAPLQSVEPPEVHDRRWSRSPVDRFLFAKLSKAGLEPARPADRATWLRRVYFDLTGLPPSIDEVQHFVTSDSLSDFGRVVEELLASPRYGERWARHWLDVVRFSETSGQQHDEDRPQHWRYRDYVVDAFNDDVPYNRFVLEHLAGDLLKDPRPGHRGETNVSPIGASFYWFSEVHHLPVDPNLQRADQVRPD